MYPAQAFKGLSALFQMTHQLKCPIHTRTLKYLTLQNYCEIFLKICLVSVAEASKEN